MASAFRGGGGSERLELFELRRGRHPAACLGVRSALLRVSCVEHVGATAEAPENMSAAVAGSENFFHALVLIDTIPRATGTCGVNGRHVKCHAGEAYQLVD